MRLRWAVIVTTFAGMSQAAAASTPAITITRQSSTSLWVNAVVKGWRFNVEQELSVTALGLWDGGRGGIVDPDGFQNENRVILRERAAGSPPTVLAATTIPSGQAAPLFDVFRYVDIPVVTLSPGVDYEILAEMPGPADALMEGTGANRFRTPAVITWLEGVTYQQQGTTFSAGLTSPRAGTFGPSFLYIVPEPATLCLVLLACSGFAVRRWRRKC